MASRRQSRALPGPRPASTGDGKAAITRQVNVALRTEFMNHGEGMTDENGVARIPFGRRAPGYRERLVGLPEDEYSAQPVTLHCRVCDAEVGRLTAFYVVPEHDRRLLELLQRGLVGVPAGVTLRCTMPPSPRLETAHLGSRVRFEYTRLDGWRDDPATTTLKLTCHSKRCHRQARRDQPTAHLLNPATLREIYMAALTNSAHPTNPPRVRLP